MAANDHEARISQVAAAVAAVGNVVQGAFSGSQPAAPAPPPLQHPLKKRQLDNWTLVKRARFNAAKRLERKSSAGIVTLAIVALYGGLISVFNLMFKHRVGGDTRDILEYVAVVSSWLTLIIGLTEQQKGHSSNARELHDCARDVNNLQKRLAATPVYDEHQLQPFLTHYGQIIDRCRPNHDEIDYTLAEVTFTRSKIDRLKAEGTWDARRHFWRRTWVRAQYHFNTYWFYVAIWLAPPLVGAVLWWLVPATPVTPG